MKLQQIDEETFIKLREEILGDEVGIQRAGLVKGLDWSMLERVRRGEVNASDVLEGGKGKVVEDEGDEGEDVDDEFEELEGRSVEAVAKEKVKKKGEMAPPSLTGKKRTRDQILADMKAARQAAKEAAQPSLGAKFKKVGERRSDIKIERDSKGREVLITIDEDGNEKRKVRKVQVQESEIEKGHGLLMPDKDVAPLGMEVPEIPKVEEEEEEINIFDDAGDDYNPLAGLGEDTDSSDDEGELKESKTIEKAPKNTEDNKAETSTPGSMQPPPRPKATARNYFGPSRSEPEVDNRPAGLKDPIFMAALKKASTLNPVQKEAENAEEAAKDARRKKMLQQDDRDAEDMDMGFGSSRFADEEDFEEKKVKLSEWAGKEGDDEDDEGGGKGKGNGKRKRGPKKRKGDANNAADVLRVMEQRKAVK